MQIILKLFQVNKESIEGYGRIKSTIRRRKTSVKRLD